ncbi:trigger factor [Mycoplasma enhydrae]|uniref:trigger factor n=1 Tax=Mycoplasma enhydrae TaxID=2499220 RepID=UPI00197BA569|nr:trigger factor [Mycoplasma enhydrae]MBN4089666.1 trigger factor [Mycoplasma enhydrae]
MSRKINENNTELIINYTLEGEEWKKALDKTRENLAKEITVPGFRKGKAPLREAEKYISESKVINKTVSRSLEDVYQKHILTQIKDDDNLTDHTPALNITEISFDKVTYEFKFPLFPKVNLGDYKGLNIKLSKLNLSKEELKKTEESILENYLVMLDSEEPIKLNDEVVFDFEGYVDGKQFDGGTSADFTLRVGSNQFIPGFETKMIGLKKGETKDLDLKFPETYHVKDLAGKDVVFKVTIHSIKTPNYPEVNDQFLKEVKLNALVNNKEDFDVFVKHNALKEKYSIAIKEFMDKAIEKINSKTTIEMSDIIIREESTKYYNDFLKNIKQQGISENDYLEFTGSTKESIIANYNNEAKKNLSHSYILGKIVEVEKLKVSEELYNKEIEKLTSIYTLSAEQIKSFFTIERFEQQKLTELVFERLAELNDPENLKAYKEADKEIKDYEEKSTRAIVTSAHQKHEQEKAKNK